MVSGLRAKLDMMRTSAPVAATPRNGGLICHVSRESLDPALLELPSTGLRRIGWCGPRFDIRRCLFLDTETTGLSGGAGTVAFLVGVGWVEGDALVIEQLMLREYADEPELIDRLSQRMAGFDSVCTYNGRNFDMPLLEARFTMNRMRDRWKTLENLDLLYPSRRAWKLRLGSCRLCNIETEVLGMAREDDLPGSEVPARFFQFMKTGEEALLDDIVRHNRQDIATSPPVRCIGLLQDPAQRARWRRCPASASPVRPTGACMPSAENPAIGRARRTYSYRCSGGGRCLARCAWSWQSSVSTKERTIQGLWNTPGNRRSIRTAKQRSSLKSG